MLELNELIEIMERGEGVVCQRFAHEYPLHFARIEAIIPRYDLRGEPDFTAICSDRAGSRCTVSVAWLRRIEKEGECSA